MSTIRTGVHSADGTVEKAPGEVPPGAGDELMQVILANLFAGVMLARASDGTILFGSPRFSTMFGYEYGELEGKPVSILNAPRTETPEEVARRIVADLRSEGAWRGEVENIRKDGSRFWCAANVTAFEHRTWGTVWVTVQLDISARKRAEAELQQSEHRLNLVLEATGSGAWDWNIQTGDVYFSRFWISSLGYTSQEVAPRVTSWENMVHPDDMPRVRHALADHFAGRTAIYECVLRLRKKDASWRWNLDRVEWWKGRPPANPSEWSAPIRIFRNNAGPDCGNSLPSVLVARASATRMEPGKRWNCTLGSGAWPGSVMGFARTASADTHTVSSISIRTVHAASRMSQLRKSSSAASHSLAGSFRSHG